MHGIPFEPRISGVCKSEWGHYFFFFFNLLLLSLLSTLIPIQHSMGDNINSEHTSKATHESNPFDLTLLKDNSQVQQFLLMALSAAQQQQQQPTASSLDNDKRKYDQLDTLSQSSKYMFQPMLDTFWLILI